MKILLNDESFEILAGSSMSSFLKELGKEDLNGWAVAINEVVVPSGEFENTFLAEGDRVLFIQATQGG